MVTPLPLIYGASCFLLLNTNNPHTPSSHQRKTNNKPNNKYGHPRRIHFKEFLPLRAMVRRRWRLKGIRGKFKRVLRKTWQLDKTRFCRKSFPKTFEITWLLEYASNVQSLSLRFFLARPLGLVLSLLSSSSFLVFSTFFITPSSRLLDGKRSVIWSLGFMCGRDINVFVFYHPRPIVDSHRVIAFILVFVELPLCIKFCPTSPKFDAFISKFENAILRAVGYFVFSLVMFLSNLINTSTLIVAAVTLLIGSIFYGKCTELFEAWQYRCPNGDLVPANYFCHCTTLAILTFLSHPILVGIAALKKQPHASSRWTGGTGVDNIV
ncbi:hypothetical protein BC938DRAFT_474270 [Jimgerdemannia flammicorona]|uniref:Uncharacterized protein n=1 Tax=Jimgerdemannia flammicorona TaxID=994334 RepID=A0A433QZM9_9FUNG|nr:hypothetical protein BC938DRAFT_474270 [Jimgerdemannia flammicorona]